ncbi:hypothetical protein J2X85_003001 [Microbacterium trichothecenolyticum]|uniref:hypothetical protein n=1 Tax=Microbacterium trichothecenolyticum TaxID=69370 RepID=UPI002860A89B|nr:hypothetical protein [Microbacterium trichothecenolyticum]MDR7185965.1 hypothetical protein [Microbacterium trichothecenolyticum]
MSATYSFVSRWRVPASPERAWAELERMLRPGAGPRWWPALTLPMPPRRIVPGERMVLAVRSPLGYSLRVLLELRDIEPGRAIGASSEGDLRGSGLVTVDADGGAASVITFHWDVETRLAWMNASGWMLRPVFERAHAYVMRRGETGLRAALGGR